MDYLVTSVPPALPSPGLAGDQMDFLHTPLTPTGNSSMLWCNGQVCMQFHFVVNHKFMEEISESQQLLCLSIIIPFNIKRRQ